MSANFNVRADFFACANAFCSKEPTRPYINGVLIDPESTASLNRPGVFIVATDGHRMAVFHDDTGSAAAPVIVMPDKDLIKHAMPGKRKHESANPGLKLIHENGLARLQQFTEKGALAEKPIAVNLSILDSTYPDWRRVLPVQPDTGWAATQLAFNGEYLGAFGDLAKRLTGSPAFALGAADSISPALIRIGGCPEFAGVLMPMRAGTANPPEWLERVYPAETAQAAE